MEVETSVVARPATTRAAPSKVRDGLLLESDSTHHAVTAGTFSAPLALADLAVSPPTGWQMLFATPAPMVPLRARSTVNELLPIGFYPQGFFGVLRLRLTEFLSVDPLPIARAAPMLRRLPVVEAVIWQVPATIRTLFHA